MQHIRWTRPRRRLAAWSLGAASALAATPTSSLGQRPLAFNELASLPAPPPTHRIAYGPGPLEFGNLRLPAGPGPNPVVVFVHGGCYLSQYTIAHTAALEQALADSGYAVWSVEYRRVGDDGGGWPGTFSDVGRAADQLRLLATQHPLDLQRVVAAGHSAGANFALWLATRHRTPKESPLHVDDPLRVAAVLALSPAGDLAALHAQGVCNNVIEKLMGGSPDRVPERYRDVSPGHLAPIGVPQILMVGGLDRAWGPPGRAYYAMATAARDTLAKLVEAPASGHFDVIAPTTTTWPLVIQSLRTLVR
jgi:acetyl esterase/lipase